VSAKFSDEEDEEVVLVRCGERKADLKSGWTLALYTQSS